MLIAGLLGNPVEQSVSPALHGELAAAAGLEMAYLKLPVPSADRLPEFLRALATLGAAGVNVTIPYKGSVLEHLDSVDPTARAVGAANTVVFDVDGATTGYNTDGIGAVAALDARLRPLRANDRVVVLGAGGAARAVTHAACRHGAKVYVLTAYDHEVESFLEALDPEVSRSVGVGILMDWQLLNALEDADFLIQATPVGMTPGLEASTVPSTLIQQLAADRDLGTLHVMDAVYNPVETRFLRDFSAAGARTCSGLWMLIYQAIAAFRLWTGDPAEKLDLDALQARLLTRLNARPPG